MFKILQWGHFFCFTFQLASFYLKKKGYYNIAQFMQCVFVPWSYFGVLSYTMYITKLHIEHWVEDINLVRVWLFIECVYFFIWILSGALFVMVAYIIKFKPTFKTEAAMAADDNVWNDKWSDDFLRFIKFDMYLFSFILSFLLMEIYIGFGEMDHINEMVPGNTDTSFDKHPVRTMFLLMIASRCGQLVHNISKMSKGKDKSDSFENENSGNILGIVHFFVDCGIYSYIAYLYFSNDNLNNHNMVAKLWVHAELITFLACIPYTFLIGY